MEDKKRKACSNDDEDDDDHGGPDRRKEQKATGSEEMDPAALAAELAAEKVTRKELEAKLAECEAQIAAERAQRSEQVMKGQPRNVGCGYSRMRIRVAGVVILAAVSAITNVVMLVEKRRLKRMLSDKSREIQSLADLQLAAVIHPENEMEGTVNSKLANVCNGTAFCTFSVYEIMCSCGGSAFGYTGDAFEFKKRILGEETETFGRGSSFGAQMSWKFDITPVRNILRLYDCSCTGCTLSMCTSNLIRGKMPSTALFSLGKGVHFTQEQTTSDSEWRVSLSLETPSSTWRNGAVSVYTEKGSGGIVQRSNVDDCTHTYVTQCYCVGTTTYCYRTPNKVTCDVQLKTFQTTQFSVEECLTGECTVETVYPNSCS